MIAQKRRLLPQLAMPKFCSLLRLDPGTEVKFRTNRWIPQHLLQMRRGRDGQSTLHRGRAAVNAAIGDRNVVTLHVHER